jgi:hypothetical protein
LVAGRAPGVGEISVKIHLVVALKKAAEEQGIDFLGLRVSGEAGVEISGNVRLEESLPLWLRRQHPPKRKRKVKAERAQRRARGRGEVWALLGRGIADFTEYGGGVRAGGAGKIAGAVVESFVGQQGKCEGFFGVFRNA